VNHPVFLIGAGFNRDARRYVTRGASIENRYEIDCNYPLVTDLAQECFGRDLRESESIEELFAAAVKVGNFVPLQRLCDALMKADWYIARRLTEPYAAGNPYMSFLDRHRGCHFLTFNYDSLLEILLLRLRAWCPIDGYGVPVRAKIDPPAAARSAVRRSSSYVLHLHGSLCIHTRSFEFVPKQGSDVEWLTQMETPEFMFDPYSIARLFLPYRGMARKPESFVPIEERVIAPVPSKAEGLTEEFIRRVHLCASDILKSSPLLVVIGYRFNELDGPSYDLLLRAFSSVAQPRATLISPDAGMLKARLTRSYPEILWEPFDATFADWANADFPGIVSPGSEASRSRKGQKPRR
jgi:hypothetical protein